MKNIIYKTLSKKALSTLAFLLFMSPSTLNAKVVQIEIDEDLQKIINSFKGIEISGQLTAIAQSSNLNLKVGDLKNASGANLSANEISQYNHKNYAGTFSADLIVEKKFDENEFIQIDLQFANGSGVDANLQGGSMVNNDVMEDENNHNEFYVAKAFYEKTINLAKNHDLTFDIGKFGVNDFFDIGEENSDQTTQFLNQAIANNGAFDYVQDLQGHGYTYGLRTGIYNCFWGLDLGFFLPILILIILMKNTRFWAQLR